MNGQKKIFVAIFLFSLFMAAHATSLTLPVYRLSIGESDIRKLLDNPEKNNAYPGIFTFNNVSHQCTVRFRGASSRNLPKKSWKITFEDNSFNNSKSLNLNAEYRDHSYMRNFLGQHLFNYSGRMAPTTRYVNLVVNDKYYGVYVETENIDGAFFKKRSTTVTTLYKGNDGANMSPLLNHQSYLSAWELEKSDDEDLSRNDLQLLFNKILYWTRDDFRLHIQEEIDVNNFLFYFAVAFSVVHYDGIYKNVFLYKTTNDNLFRILSWDMGASLGNSADGGYTVDFATLGMSKLRYHLVFQRLMEYPDYQEIFWNHVREIATNGFDYLNILVDSTLEAIKNDVSIDPEKDTSGVDFDSSVQQIKTFLSRRAKYLKTAAGPVKKIPLTNFYCSHPHTYGNKNEIVFRINSEKPQNIKVKFVENLVFGSWGSTFDVRYLELFDDGNHNDGAADDLVYGNSLPVETFSCQIIPFAILGSSYRIPQNEVMYIQYHPGKSFALNLAMHTNSGLQQVHFGTLFNHENDYFLHLINPSGQDIDLSYFTFQGAAYYHNYMFVPGTILSKNDTVIITNNRLKAQSLFPKNHIIGDTYFKITSSDTIRLLSPVMNDLGINTVVHAIAIEPTLEVTAVITEINSRSTSSHPTGDWIELFNPCSHTIDLSNWVLGDGNRKHRFVIPQKTLLKSKEYAVFCENSERFKATHSSIKIHGEFLFGLNQESEHLYLENEAGIIVDSLSYDKETWPIGYDSTGKTMELVSPWYDNSASSNWKLSLVNGGSPGKSNSVSRKNIPPDNPVFPDRIRATHTPFGSTFTIPLQLFNESMVTITTCNILGRLVATHVNRRYPAGRHAITFVHLHNTPGAYFYNLKIDGKSRCTYMKVQL